jgi:hypothetical protein
MIAALVAMFGDGDALPNLTKAIEGIKTQINAKNASRREAEGVLGRLLQSSAQISAPPGSLAEVQGELRDLHDQLHKTQLELNEEIARERAIELQREAEAERIKKEAEKKPEPRAVPETTLKKPEVGQAMGRLQEYSRRAQLPFEPDFNYKVFVHGFIKKLEDAIAALDCPACKSVVVKSVVRVAKTQLEGMEKHGKQK